MSIIQFFRRKCRADETATVYYIGYDSVGDKEHGIIREHGTIHVMECSECGHTYEHVNGSYEYCPRCGRKVVGE